MLEPYRGHVLSAVSLNCMLELVILSVACYFIPLFILHAECATHTSRVRDVTPYAQSLFQIPYNLAKCDIPPLLRLAALKKFPTLLAMSGLAVKYVSYVQ